MRKPDYNSAKLQCVMQPKQVLITITTFNGTITTYKRYPSTWIAKVLRNMGQMRAGGSSADEAA